MVSCSFIPRQRVFFSGPPFGEAASGVNGREVDPFVYIYIYICSGIHTYLRRTYYSEMHISRVPILLEIFQNHITFVFFGGRTLDVFNVAT